MWYRFEQIRRKLSYCKTEVKYPDWQTPSLVKPEVEFCLSEIEKLRQELNQWEEELRNVRRQIEDLDQTE